MKYCCTVAYLGQAYQGFERQPNLPTIQGNLEKQLSFLLGKETEIKGAGRTDAGVNALGQSFSFETGKAIEDLGAFKDALNRLLPRDIAIMSLREVPAAFDARHSSCGKRYEYRFSYGEKVPLQRDTVAFIGNRTDFNKEAFERAIALFEGEHWFGNFTCKKEDKDGFVRNVHIERCEVDEKQRVGVVAFSGNGFMTYMIRFMVGAAFKAAFGKITNQELSLRLEKGERQIVPFKAPAEGLTLLEVLYHGE